MTSRTEAIVPFTKSDDTDYDDCDDDTSNCKDALRCVKMKALEFAKHGAWNH